MSSLVAAHSRSALPESRWHLQSAVQMALSVRHREITAAELIRDTLERIAATDGRVNAFTDVLAQRALNRAASVDQQLAASDERAVAALPLLGVPFAVKNLFDVQGLTTRAGSRIERDQPPATADATLVARMERAGAILVGALNMDEYAYGFTTENSHDGAVHNPHDLNRIAGGSSGGSGAALAAGQVPLTLGSDTNGSIRVPASLCGVFGLKPTYGQLPRTGSYPFVASLDHVGPMARSVTDLALAYDALQGLDAKDPACSQRASEPCVAEIVRGTDGLRIAVLDGYFHDRAGSVAQAAVALVADALRVTKRVQLPAVDAARAAAFLITNAEGAALHLPDLRRRAADFEPLSRDRFLAGALLPAAWIIEAQRMRRWFAAEVAQVLKTVDVLLAPATPCPAMPIGSEWIEIGGERLPLRPSMGLLTQPISCIGLPVCAVPVWTAQSTLPIGVQVIAAPWREDLTLRVAAALEAGGIVSAPVAAL